MTAWVRMNREGFDQFYINVLGKKFWLAVGEDGIVRNDYKLGKTQFQGKHINELWRKLIKKGIDAGWELEVK